MSNPRSFAALILTSLSATVLLVCVSFPVPGKTPSQVENRVELPVDPIPTVIARPPVIATPPLTAVTRPRLEITIPPPANNTHTDFVTPPPDGDHRESPDCTVRKFVCARRCDPLSSNWDSYLPCVKYECDKVEQSCIEKLAEDMKQRPKNEDNFVTFQVTSHYRKTIQIAFYSQDRNAVWSGGGGAYTIDDDAAHSYKLKTRSGEKNCYGAWVPGDNLYWGLGRDEYDCKNCCLYGNGGTSAYNLVSAN